MSVLLSSELFSPVSEDIPHHAVVRLSRLQVRVDIEQSCIAGAASEIVRLMDRFMPGIPHLLGIDGTAMVVKVRCKTLKVCQTDLFVGRLARIQGVFHVMAEQRNDTDGIVFGAAIRGRSRSVRFCS